MSTVKIPRADGNETRQRLKDVAQRLFAHRGIDGVSIKDIVAAAGQRNNASLHYHFGSKEALVAELLVDGAKAIDATRQAMLKRLLSEGAPLTLRGVLEALVHPVSQLTDNEGGSAYMRFQADLQRNHRKFFRATLGDRWNVGYRKCLDLLREILSDVPPPLLEQRISMMGIYANAIFAAKEAALDDAHAPNRFWSPEHTLENITDTLQAVLECPPSGKTIAMLKTDGGASARAGRG